MANKLNAENQFTLVIEAGQTSRNYWKDLWRYRDLFFFLVWRDILVRYKQTVVGIAWVVIRPIMTMLVFTLICYADIPMACKSRLFTQKVFNA